MELFAKCIENNGYEWLLDKGYFYTVDSWTDKTIVIMHPKCGKYGLNKDRFEFYPPEENLIIDYKDYSRNGLKRYRICTY